MTEWNDTKLRWTDADIADVEQTAKAGERARLLELIKRNICFDALADPDGRCSHHGGKCYELGQLIKGENK